ncbi:TrbG/VirB9 family P-type conjugative transfer protein [Acidihalobacter prosperus]|uniref:Conjugal transfer protein TrbG n=1 Tax=Acidihalobacter prosperus TaxID=160660 RepID=A0A1A6C015_9GAMM|nr:TrbG/VirB9 family P-type conjugative transfer protein [Acidihalobacter prosperus]OBS07898.1 hypothetical protein Thpro_022148 [Acidihalobacter prosperus]
MKRTALFLLLGLTTASGALPIAQADGVPYPSALSARLVRFVYNPNQTYTLYLRPGMGTDIQLPRGEHLVSLQLGDTVQWITSYVQGTGNILIKPVRPGIETSATLITSAHTYQMMLVSRNKGAWYQGVKFTPENPLVLLNPANEQSAALNPSLSADAHTADGTSSPASPSGDSADALADVNVSQMNFAWRVKGRARFAPTEVFSTPDFIWLRLPQDAPAPVVFGWQGGQWGIVNYNRRGPWIVVQGAPAAVELRANGRSVVAWRQGAKASGGGSQTPAAETSSSFVWGQ